MYVIIIVKHIVTRHFAACSFPITKEDVIGRPILSHSFILFERHLTLTCVYHMVTSLRYIYRLIGHFFSLAGTDNLLSFYCTSRLYAMHIWGVVERTRSLGRGLTVNSLNNGKRFNVLSTLPKEYEAFSFS